MLGKVRKQKDNKMDDYDVCDDKHAAKKTPSVNRKFWRNTIHKGHNKYDKGLKAKVKPHECINKSPRRQCLHYYSK